MDDDLNISAAIASIFRNVKKINILVLEKKIDAAAAGKILDAFRNIDSVLNVFDFDGPASDPEILKLIEQREKAREDKNWDLADKIRDQLKLRGIMIQDNKIQ